MRRLVALMVVAALCAGCDREKDIHTFGIGDGNFLVDGEPIHLYSGEMHFSRIPHEYWPHRLQMARAMGLNTIATYIFWNYHETAPGVWDFETGNRNLRKFIQLAGQEGLMVILRPGPYACAEWEFGGYPWWLQNNRELVIREYNQAFLDSCQVYISRLVDEFRDLQASRGGPVIMVQVENEFGSYVAQRPDIPLGKHKAYSHAIRDQLIAAGVEVPLFTSDGSWLFEGGAVDGVFPTANGEDDIDNLKKVVNEYNGGQGPYMVAEFYPGWLAHWAEPFPRVAAEDVVAQMKKYLDGGVSFNFYMLHGGTNFGFTSGANYNGDHDIQPDLTSYDYDAPISEAGWPTHKYMAIREVLLGHVPYEVPDVPDSIPLIRIPSIRLNKAADYGNLIMQARPVENNRPLTFEELGQGHGYVLYARLFEEGIGGTLEIAGLRDYATLYINGRFAGELNRYYKDYTLDIDIPDGGVLEILVENMGRINYGAEIVNNRKGIISPVTINGKEITGGWRMYGLPMASPPDVLSFESNHIQGRPAVYHGSFRLDATGDTFLDMRGWGKGIVFVNGHHLGRYWQAGPQQTLYLPGVWLNEGENEIVIFEQLNDSPGKEVRGITTPILEELMQDQRSK